jgi:hypothetical protein
MNRKHLVSIQVILYFRPPKKDVRIVAVRDIEAGPVYMNY